MACLGYVSCSRLGRRDQRQVVAVARGILGNHVRQRPPIGVHVARLIELPVRDQVPAGHALLQADGRKQAVLSVAHMHVSRLVLKQGDD